MVQVTSVSRLQMLQAMAGTINNSPTTILNIPISLRRIPKWKSINRNFANRRDQTLQKTNFFLWQTSLPIYCSSMLICWRYKFTSIILAITSQFHFNVLIRKAGENLEPSRNYFRCWLLLVQKKSWKCKHYQLSEERNHRLEDEINCCRKSSRYARKNFRNADYKIIVFQLLQAIWELIIL